MHKKFKVKGLSHGGKVLAMAEKYAIPAEQWLDLSTGLNPVSWPVPEIPSAYWQQLPQDEDTLQQVACEYYGCDYCLPVAGSQAAIQVLPRLRNKSRVGIVSPSYIEHLHAWQKNDHDILRLRHDQIDQHIEQLDVLVIVNPNNPTGHRVEVSQLLQWHQVLTRKGGWLVVDEAFIDVFPGESIISQGIKPGLVVLRSIGKFFGLAGIRCGFVITDTDLLTRISEEIGPWSVTNPTRYIATRALSDQQWHETNRKNLKHDAARMQVCLNEKGFNVKQHGVLFHWFEHKQAEAIFNFFASKAVLIRYFEPGFSGKPGLRFGLPGSEKDWCTFEKVLDELPRELVENNEDNIYA